MVRLKFIGLDVGDKNVGTALADSQAAVAVAYKTFSRAKGVAEQEILKLIKENGIATVVAGLPLSEDGSKNEQCSKVENFCTRIKKRSGVEVVYIDEYLTSVEAEERLRNAGLKTSRGKKVAIDALSAAIILQLYLDSDEISGT